MHEIYDGSIKPVSETINIDCSGYIDGSVFNLTDAETDTLYRNYNIEEKAKWEYRYPLRKFFLKDGTFIEFSLNEFKKIVLAYSSAIRFAVDTYNEAVKSSGREINEARIVVLINSNAMKASYQAHLLFASELIGAGVNIASMVLKFSNGDMITDRTEGKLQDAELNTHSKIAAFFGYKIRFFTDCNSENEF